MVKKELQREIHGSVVALNKDKIVYSIVFHLNNDKVEGYTYQTEVSAYGFLNDNTFEQREFIDNDYIDKDYILGTLTETELEY